KVREIAHLLVPFRLEVVSAGDLDLAEPEETGDTFRANAELKALAAAQASGLPALADDSGLCVNALNGAPGVHSARWAGPTRDFDFALEKLRRGMIEAGLSDTSAYFVCGLALAWPDGHIEYFEGRVDGELTWPPRGENGFGYDPIFIPDGHELTFGEMEAQAKHRMSHRADAFRQLVDRCFGKLRRLTDGAAGNGRRLCCLCPLALLPVEMPRVRVQFACHGECGSGALGPRAHARTARYARPHRPAPRALRLFRRRHAVADAAANGRYGASGNRFPLVDGGGGGDHARSQSDQR